MQIPRCRDRWGLAWRYAAAMSLSCHWAQSLLLLRSNIDKLNTAPRVIPIDITHLTLVALQPGHLPESSTEAHAPKHGADWRQQRQATFQCMRGDAPSAHSPSKASTHVMLKLRMDPRLGRRWPWCKPRMNDGGRRNKKRRRSRGGGNDTGKRKQGAHGTMNPGRAPDDGLALLGLALLGLLLAGLALLRGRGLGNLALTMRGSESMRYTQRMSNAILSPLAGPKFDQRGTRPKVMHPSRSTTPNGHCSGRLDAQKKRDGPTEPPPDKPPALPTISAPSSTLPSCSLSSNRPWS